MELRIKKRLTYVATCVYFLISGAEYGVIFTTLYPYVKSLDGNESFYGITFAAFTISSVFANPLFGLVTDRMKKTKSIVLVANMFEIGGNLMYFVGSSKYMLLGGRLVAGIGVGGGAAIYAQLAWMSTEEERTSVMSMVIACRQFGILASPAFNIFLREIHFQLGPFKVNQLSVPGLFMAVLWFAMQIVIVFMYFDLSSIHQPVSNDASTKDDGKISENKTDDVMSHAGDVICTSSQSLDEAALVSIKSERHRTTLGYTDQKSKNYFLQCQSYQIWRKLCSVAGGYLCEEIVLLLGISFTINLSLVALESLIVPLSGKLFEWNAVDNSYFFSGSALLAMATYFTIQRLSKYVSDCWIMVIGLVLETLGVCVLIIFTPRMKPLHNTTRNTVILMFGSALLTIGYPCALISSTSLLSKLTSMTVQGMTQAIRRVVSHFGVIMGPVWAATFLARLNIMFGVMLGLHVLMLAMTALSFKKLRRKPILGQKDAKEEKRPLLSEEHGL